MGYLNKSENLGNENITITTVLEILEKLEETLEIAYYSTPAHISSKSLILRALKLVRAGKMFVSKELIISDKGHS